jgi:fatty acid desaturase
MEEIVTSIFAISAVCFAVAGLLPWEFILQWFIICSSLAALNAVQFLALHRYEARGSYLDAQISDSLNTSGSVLTSLWAPVGQRFHALHHSFPTLPYHNLSEAHRRLTQSLPIDSIYRTAENSSLRVALFSLWKRTGRKHRIPSHLIAQPNNIYL